MGIYDTKETYNAYMRKYKRKRHFTLRQQTIKMLGGKCVTCGSIDNLQFDHRDRNDKIEDPAIFDSISKERFNVEIKKCQLLCRTCHIKKTLKELGKKEAKGFHGTISTYRYCHCELCKQAKIEYRKKYLKTHKRITINGKRITVPL